MFGIPNNWDKVAGFVQVIGTRCRTSLRSKWDSAPRSSVEACCILRTGALFDDTRHIREMHRNRVKGDSP
ncbi:hypothetical protein TQ38_022410 [Novosphingobium sp. P6W]|nr:hypothetical protein TQ38_022410 [Novosphingobium sp. P6W]